MDRALIPGWRQPGGRLLGGVVLCLAPAPLTLLIGVFTVPGWEALRN